LRRLTLACAILTTALIGTSASASAASLKVEWMQGFSAPGTPAKYNKVGVLKIGPRSAKNVLVFVPGTSSGAAYFAPFAQWLVSRTKGWQVWSVERRENLFEDQSEMNLAKQGKATAKGLFDYYLGYIADPTITRHIHPVPDSQVGYARGWGLNVAIEDLHRVIASAQKLGGKVVLAGHSLGGSVVTAYATWDFGGKPGADGLAGVVYDDGASFRAPVSAAAARAELQALQKGSPWLAFSGIPAPDLGLFAATGSLGALIDPNGPSIGYAFPLLPSSLKPPVQPTNLALFGYDTDPATSKLVFAAQAHVGRLDTNLTPAGWDRAGAITPLQRWAAMLAGPGVQNADGSEWYFPQRLTDDTGAIGNGIANPAQHVLGVHSVFGRRLPRTLLMYAFGAYGGQSILDATKSLASQSHIPMRNLMLVNRHATYAHNDPAGAYPHNAFFDGLVRFVARISRRG
jgi:pimeloyl-ACP methyl ester carboxylesterase